MINREKKIKMEEGFREMPYLCSTGHLTSGVGFNLEETPMPEEVADLWLRILIDNIIEELSVLDWYQTLNFDRQTVIIDMCYQIGVSGVLKFKRMIAAIESGDYRLASIEMLASKWAQQTPSRAQRNADAMLMGELV